MKALLNKTTSTIAGAALFVLGLGMAGLGLSVVALLGLFALGAAGLALLAAPLVALAHPEADVDEDDADAPVSA